MDYKAFDILWIEDEDDIVGDTIDSLNNGSNGKYGVIPHHYISAESFFNEVGNDLKNLAFTIALIDYNLPGGINGDEIIKKIREHKNNKGLPIVFYSAFKTPNELKVILVEEIGDVEGIIYATKETYEDEVYTYLSRLS